MTTRLNFYAAYLVIAGFSAVCWWSLIVETVTLTPPPPRRGVPRWKRNQRTNQRATTQRSRRLARQAGRP